MEWVKDAGFDTLLQLKIQAATGYQKLKITGKSQQGDNKWIRFNKNLTVSSDYDLNQVRAKFEGGVLYIKHP
uniref:SHSP domain-containing protein n=1 Tax=Salix viminalis TaxID=40686 RepID=A0A6N2L8M3_SALVM